MPGVRRRINRSKPSEITGELMHLTLDLPGNGPDACDGDIGASSVFEKIEEVAWAPKQFETFLDLYEFARACLLNFESEVDNS